MLEYMVGTRTIDALRQDLDVFFREARADADSDAARMLGEAGFDRPAEGMEEQPISLLPDSAGIDAETTRILVDFAPLVARVAEDMWRRVVLPWIIRRRGGDALGPEVTTREQADDEPR